MRIRNILLLVFIILLLVISSYFVSSWWNNDYNYRTKINLKSGSTPYVFAVNDTSGIYGMTIWALMNNDSYIYNFDAGLNNNWTIANDTDIKYFEADFYDDIGVGNKSSSNNPQAVWDDYVLVWHMENNLTGGLKDHTRNNLNNKRDTLLDSMFNIINVSDNAKFGHSLAFLSGAYNYINISDNPILEFNNFTIELWVNTDYLINYRPWVSKGMNGMTPFYFLGTNDADHILFLMEDSTGACQCETQGVITAGVWTYVVATWDGNSCSIYKDGSLVPVDVTDNCNKNSVFGQNDADFQIGNQGKITNFGGNIDELRIKNYSVDANYVLYQYWNGKNNLTTLGTEETSPPIINLQSPINNTYGYLSSVNFIYNVSGYRTIDNCSLWLNDGISWNKNQTVFGESTWTNQSDGFKTNPYLLYGLETNGSDFWIINYRTVYHVDKNGNNITDGFSIGGNDLRDITTNGSDFWITDDIDFVHHVNRTGGNITDGFSTATLGSTTPYGITTNGSDFWITDYNDDFVYHTDKSGYNYSDGFSTVTLGSEDPYGITTNGSDFWIADSTDNWIYHTNRIGGNITDGFSTSTMGVGELEGIATNGSDLWITDSVDFFVYHIKKWGINQGVNNTISISNLAVGNYSWLVSCIDDNLFISNSTTFNYTVYDSIGKVDLQSPANETSSYTHSVNFTYNVSDDDNAINNCSLWLRHSFAGTDEKNSTNILITEAINQTFNLTLGHENVYWKVGCYNDASLQTNSSEYNYTVYQDITPPVNNIYSPINNTNSSTSYINFTYNVSDLSSSIKNCSLYLFKSGQWELNLTDTNIESDINNTLNITIEDTNLLWKVGCYDTDENPINSSSYNLTIDTTAPIINTYLPLNNTNSSSSYINFTYNATDVGLSISSCNLWLNKQGIWELNKTDSNIEETINQTLNITIQDTNLLWLIECNDTLNNKANSSAYNLTVDTTKPYLVQFDTINDLTTSASMANISIRYTAKDSLTGIQNLSYTLTWSGSSRNIAISYNTSFYLPMDIYGDFELRLYAQDYSNNVNSSSQNFIVSYEQTQPSTGPSDYTPPTEPVVEPIVPVEEPFSPENPEIIPSNPGDATQPAQDVIYEAINDLIDQLGDKATPEDLQNLVDELEEIGIIVTPEDIKVWYEDIIFTVNPIVERTGGGGGGAIEENIGFPEIIFNEDLSQHIIITTPWGMDSYSLLTSPNQELERDWIIVNKGTAVETIEINLFNSGLTDINPAEWVTLTGDAITYNPITKSYTLTLQPGENIENILRNNIKIPDYVEFGEEFFYSIVLSQNGKYLGKLDFKMEMTKKSLIFQVGDIIKQSRIEIPRLSKDGVAQPPLKIPNYTFIFIIPFIIAFLLGLLLFGWLGKNSITLGLIFFIVSSASILFAFFVL